jgi:hypothetical protein
LRNCSGRQGRIVQHRIQRQKAVGRRWWQRCNSQALGRRLQHRKGALTKRSPLNGEDRARAVVVNDRNVNPRSLFHELDVAPPVSLDKRKADREDIVRDLHGNAVEGNPSRRLARFHQYPGHVGNLAMREVRRQGKHKLERVTGGKREVVIAPQVQFHHHPESWYFNIGSQRKC